MQPSMERSATAPPSRRRDERGASLVEFALVATLLFTLLLGIVIFGVLLSKRQVLTQAAAEGARSAVPVRYSAAAPDNLVNAARAKTNQSLEAVGGNRQCPAPPPGPLSSFVTVGTLNVDGIRCTFTVFDCTSSPRAQTVADTNDCIEVKVELSVSQSPALVPGSGLVAPFVPELMTGRSVVGLSGLSS